MADDTLLTQTDIQKRMNCHGRTADRIETAFVTVEKLVEATESDEDLTEYPGIGPKTEPVIEEWWDNRFERERQMDASSVERTGAKTATIHLHQSWADAIGMETEDSGE
jgi:hypothetical protein